VLTADTETEIVAILESLTDNQAKITGKKALKKALNQHTFKHRALQVGKILMEQEHLY